MTGFSPLSQVQRRQQCLMPLPHLHPAACTPIVASLPWESWGEEAGIPAYRRRTRLPAAPVWEEVLAGDSPTCACLRVWIWLIDTLAPGNFSSSQETLLLIDAPSSYTCRLSQLWLIEAMDSRYSSVQLC